MSTKRAPTPDKKWIQSNRGDYQGNIVETLNIDLDTNQGVLKSAKKLTKVLDDTQMDESSESPVSISIYDNKYYLVTTDQVFSCSVNNDPRETANWSAIATLGSEDLGNETDSVVFDNNFLVSLGTDIMSWNGTTKDNNWWTTVSLGGGVGAALTANVPHMLKVLRSGRDTLFVTDGNKIRYANAGAGHSTITLEDQFTTRCLTESLDRMWVGTQVEVEERAYVFECIVGQTDTLAQPIYNQSYPIEGRAALAMFTYKNTPFVITNLGYIQVFNGAEFTTVAQFPWADESVTMEGVRPGLVQTSMRATAIHPNGVFVSGKTAYILVDAKDEFLSGDLLDKGLSGVWTLDLETYSLNHKYSLDGAVRMSSSGPVFITNTPQTRILVGCETDTPGLFAESATANVSYVVQSRHESNSIADAFEKFVVKTDMLDSGSSVQVKYRNTKLSTLPITFNNVTWLNDTQFTTLSDTTDVQEGYEVFVENGQGAGKLTNITAIEQSASTSTITVDDSIGSAGTTSDIRVDNWLVFTDTMSSENGEYKDFGGNEHVYHHVQYKVVLNGPVTVREIISKSNTKEEL